ncbi:MAG: hypothetical protein QOI34_475 [Verrucomicrobiota bacterium]|jgi:HSP20 family protein
MNTTVRESRNGQRAQAEQFVAPISSVIEDPEKYLLHLEMPGVNKEGLEIAVENNELTILGRRSLPSIEGVLIHRESRPHDFRRTFELDPSIDTGRIAGKIDQGVVMLTLPKAEQVKPRKIKVD